ncbi:SPOR domain-containing protein [Sphingosinicella sp. YJ22]|nr:SPOR domain-containing protein [Sphingosinicella sp. YJ22]
MPAGALTRLRAGPLASRAAADRICAAVRAAGEACIPVAP